MSQETYHKSVLVDEVLEYLSPKPGGVYVDATFGGGGHTRAILEYEPECSVIGMDWDMVALEKNGEPLQEEFPDRLTLVWGNFADIVRKLKKQGITKIDGVLADFGTSQFQLFERAGFSFHHDTPLDMRMSPAHQKATAAEIINKATPEKLIEIFKEYGQEPFARKIVRAIVAERSNKHFQTTGQLAKLVESVVGKSKKRIHPATRVFQALRIFVNDELHNIDSFLKGSLKVLAPHGRIVCISFHSLEDRIVKQFFKEYSSKGELNILTPKVIIPTAQEVEKNPSSRSSKLRAAEYIG